MKLPRALWWRTPLAGGFVLALLVLWGEALVQVALPATRLALGVLAPEFQVQSLSLDRNAIDRVVLLKVSVERSIILRGQAWLPGPGSQAQASTLALQCLHGPALALWLTLAWPGVGLTRMLCAVVLSVLLVLVDLPAVLAGAAWQTLVDSLAPGDSTPLLAWKAFISQGGRLALGLAAGGAAVLICEQRSIDQPVTGLSRALTRFVRKFRPQH